MSNIISLNFIVLHFIFELQLAVCFLQISDKRFYSIFFFEILYFRRIDKMYSIILKQLIDGLTAISVFNITFTIFQANRKVLPEKLKQVSDFSSYDDVD